MATIAEVVEQIGLELERANYPIAEPERRMLAAIFSTFEIDTLSKANEISNKELFAAFAKVAILAARHRQEKFGDLKDSKTTRIAPSDLLPAFWYVSLVGGYGRPSPLFPDGNLFPPPPRSLFNRDMFDILRRCCPWC